MAAPNSPPISVIMPMRDAATYLRPAVESILAQTFKDFELIVVNDHSEDASESIVKDFDDPRIRLHPNTGPSGVAHAFNAGLEAARGSYVARMDADDISVPHRLQTQFTFLGRHPEAEIAGAGISLLDPSGRLHKDRSIRPSLPMHVRWSLLFYCCLAFPTVIARRQTLLDLGGCDPQYSPSDDYDLWIRAVEAGVAVTNIPDVLLNYRINPTGLSHSPQSKMNNISISLSQAALTRFLGPDEPVQLKTLQVLRDPVRLRGEDDAEGAVREAVRLLERTIQVLEDHDVDRESLRTINKHAADYANRLLLYALTMSPRSSFAAVRGSNLLTASGLASYAGRAAARRAAAVVANPRAKGVS